MFSGYSSIGSWNGAGFLDSLDDKMSTSVRMRSVLISTCCVCSDGNSERGREVEVIEFECFRASSFFRIV